MDTRQKIIEAAARLFHEQGYAATGIAAILKEAGVNAGSMYHYFDGKEALLAEVLDWYRDNLVPRIMKPIEAAEPDPLRRVFRLLGWYRDFLAEHDCRLGCPVGNLALEVSDTHPQLRARLGRNLERWSGRLRLWLEQAAERLPPDCDRDSLARFVLTVMEGAVMQARTAGSLRPFDEAVAQLRRHFAALEREAERAAGPKAPAMAVNG